MKSLYNLNIFFALLILLIFLPACDNNDSSQESNDIHDFIREVGDLQRLGRQLVITLDGQSEVITVKGVAYSPIAIGASFDDSNIGDIFFNNGDDAFWEPIWQRDLEKIREMGANTIRLYSMWPWDPFWQGSGTFSPVPPPPGSEHFRDHTKFLDMVLQQNPDDPLVCAFVAYPVRSEIFDYCSCVDSACGCSSADPSEIVMTNSGAEFRRTGNTTVQDQDRVAYTTLAEQLKDNDTVWGFVIGNELNNDIRRSDPEYWNYIDSVAADIKQIAPLKETMVTLLDDSMISIPLAKNIGPSMCAVVDPDGTITVGSEPCTADTDCTSPNSICEEMPNIDIWGINSFRGTQTEGFDRLFGDYQNASRKPFIVTEFGPAASTRDSESCASGNAVELPDNALAQADYLEVHWNDIRRTTINPAFGETSPPSEVTSGGIVFEWTDEWWKAGTPGIHNGGTNANLAFPGGCADEEWFGINSVILKRNSPSDFPFPFVADELDPRDAFERIKNIWTGN